MPRIIVLDPLSQDGLDLLESAGNMEVEVRTGLKGDDLRKALLEADGAICRSGVKITAEVLEGNRGCGPSPGPAWASTTSTPRPPRGRASWS